MVGLSKVLFNQISSDGDESAYLSLGLALWEEGVLSDGTRPPLYSFILTPVAEREWSYFTSAKLITLGIGGLTILATFWLGMRLLGWQAALIAAFFLAANKEFHIRSATVYADILLALVMIGAWYYLIKSVEGWKNAILGGVFVGLSFLTKGSAPVLLLAWGLMALVHFRFTIFRQFHLVLVPLFFVIVSAPLLIYNANIWGSPTYNFATQHIMWMDRLEQINTAHPADLPTAATYFATHTPADMIERVQKGLRRLNPVISRSVIPGRNFEPAWVGPVLGIVTLAVLIYLLLYQRLALGWYLRERKNILLFTGILYAIFYPFFTWYVAGSSAETRFVVPLLAPLYLILADALVLLGQGLWKRLSPPYYHLPLTIYRVILILLILGGLGWLIQTTWTERWALQQNPYESDRLANQEPEAIVQWLSQDNPTEEAFVSFGPSKSLPLWKFPSRFTIERLPVDVNSWQAMEAYIQQTKPAYLILDEDTVRRRRQALATYFSYDQEQNHISFEQVPPGWTLNHISPALPCRWCIFSPSPDTAAPLATFDNGLELLEWRINPNPTSQQLENDQLLMTNYQSPLHLSLTWQSTHPLPTDYTFFVHLTAPDGFVKAQQDQQPFAGTYPASRWQPDAQFADRFELVLNESVTPGDYLLLAGLYDPATGERVALVDGPVGPAPATVLLGRMTVEND